MSTAHRAPGSCRAAIMFVSRTSGHVLRRTERTRATRRSVRTRDATRPISVETRSAEIVCPPRAEDAENADKDDCAATDVGRTDVRVKHDENETITGNNVRRGAPTTPPRTCTGCSRTTCVVRNSRVYSIRIATCAYPENTRYTRSRP